MSVNVLTIADEAAIKGSATRTLVLTDAAEYAGAASAGDACRKAGESTASLFLPALATPAKDNAKRAGASKGASASLWAQGMSGMERRAAIKEAAITALRATAAMLMVSALGIVLLGFFLWVAYSGVLEGTVADSPSVYGLPALLAISIFWNSCTAWQWVTKRKAGEAGEAREGADSGYQGSGYYEGWPYSSTYWR